MSRSDAIRLPPGEPRCEPSRGCVVRSRCARALASIPKQGASLADFTLATLGGGTALCVRYVNVTTLHALPEPKPAPVVRPSVKGLG